MKERETECEKNDTANVVKPTCVCELHCFSPKTVVSYQSSVVSFLWPSAVSFQLSDTNVQKNFSSVDSSTSSRHVRAMQAIKVEATVTKEGELHLTNLPVHPDQQVEVIVLIREESHAPPVASLPAVNDHEWQTLVDTIRQSEPRFPTLDDAMNVTRRCA